MSAGDLGASGVGVVLADAGFFVGFDLGDAAVVDGDLDGAEADGADFSRTTASQRASSEAAEGWGSVLMGGGVVGLHGNRMSTCQMGIEREGVGGKMGEKGVGGLG